MQAQPSTGRPQSIALIMPPQTGSVIVVSAIVGEASFAKANTFSTPNARIFTVPARSTGPTSTVRYTPDPVELTATDFALDRAAEGVHGENIVPLGDTIATDGQGSVSHVT